MPFTFAHPFAVLPLLKKRRYFSATGLIIGSIIPDFESFMKMDDAKVHSHTWAGMFWFDIPVAVIATIIYHGILRDQLIENLPTPLVRRFSRIIGFRWSVYLKKHFIKVIISIIIGIATHMLLDAATHLNLAHPDSRASKLYVGSVRLYILLQYATTFIGFVLIAWYIYRQPKSYTIDLSENRIQFWIIAASISAMVIAVVLYWGPKGEKNVIGYLDIAISSILIGLVATAFFTGFDKIRRRILQISIDQ